MLARAMEAIEMVMMRIGAIVAVPSALAHVGMACTVMLPRVTAATRHPGNLGENSSDAKITRYLGR